MKDTENVAKVHPDERTKDGPLDWIRECNGNDVSNMVIAPDVTKMHIATTNNFGHPAKIDPVCSGKMS